MGGGVVRGDRRDHALGVEVVERGVGEGGGGGTGEGGVGQVAQKEHED